MNALHRVLAAYMETSSAAELESIRYYALAAKRFEEGNIPLSNLCFRRAIRMHVFAEEMRGTEKLLRATFKEW